ncbi:MAG: RagB/SusD family nutrient uptake outer membrane protein [Paludibacter sp.]
MKTKILFFSSLMLLFSSCTDFLAYDESSSYSEDQVFTMYSMSTQMATNVYSYLKSDFGSVGSAMRAAGCDEAEYVWPSSTVHTYYDGSWSQINTVDDVWAVNYKGIRAANLFLEKGVGQTFVENKYQSGYDKAMIKYNNLQYEVRFLRAYFYFELMKRYGGVPLITKVLTEQEADTVSRNTYDNVSAFIVNECDTAAKYLPKFYDATYDAETGRVTRMTALALKARVLLYGASKLHNNPSVPDKWINAAKASKALIDSASVYKINSLLPYDKIPNNIALPELIFARREANSGTFEALNYPVGFVGGNSGTCPTQNLVDAYEVKKTGIKYDSIVFDWNKSSLRANPYANRDSRLALTVVLNNTLWADNQKVEAWEGGNSGLPKSGATKTGYYLKKYMDKTISFQPSGTTSSRHVWVIFRYAEVLLNYAEAMNEAFPTPTYKDATFTLSALEAINLVRSRTGVALIAIPTSLNTADFRAKVRNERMVELAFEDHRFWDIRRWMIGPETVAIKRTKIVKDPVTALFTYSTYTTNNRIWDDKMYYYPIPLSEIYKNGNLIQNLGWE